MQKNKLHILIVEDDLLIAEMLKEMLLELQYEVIGIASNYATAIEHLKNNKSIDLCFVDINLEEEKTGFDIVEIINSTYHIPFVFLTSYSDNKTISQAVTYKPEAYLLKPFSQTNLYTTIEIIRGRSESNNVQSKYIIIKDGSLNVKLKTSDIYWVKSDNVYVEVKTSEKTYVVRNSLEKFIEELDLLSFIRTHRSYAVNLMHVHAVTGQYLLVGQDKIPLSRKFRDTIHEHFAAV